MQGNTKQNRADHTGLTRRQRQVLWGIARGMSNKNMAVLLGIDIKTVEKHRENVCDTLGFCGAAPLTRYAIAIGLIPVPIPADFANPQTVTAGIGIDTAGDKPPLGMPVIRTPPSPYVVAGERAACVIRPDDSTWLEPQPGVRQDAPDYKPTTDKVEK